MSLRMDNGSKQHGPKEMMGHEEKTFFKENVGLGKRCVPKGG